MDSITQVALGASVAGAVAGKTLGRSALVIGGVLGTLPDLDVVIDYGSAVSNFTQHRGFSHSLFVLIPLAVGLAWAFWRWRPQPGFRRWLTLTTLVLVTHPLLDCFTTYGTQMFWPFGPPIAISSIFIIDPLYTLPLLVGCVFFLVRPPAQTAVLAGLMVSGLYLGWTLVAQQVISARVQPALAQSGLKNPTLLVQPMPFNTVLWRTTAVTEQHHVEIVTGFFDGDAPLTLEYFPRHPELARAVSGFPETQRLEWFTRGLLDYNLDGDRITATDIRLGIPGAHPFTFVLARKHDHEIQPVSSVRAPRPQMDPEALGVLWTRLTGETPVLCLANLATPTPGQSC